MEDGGNGHKWKRVKRAEKEGRKTGKKGMGKTGRNGKGEKRGEMEEEKRIQMEKGQYLIETSCDFHQLQAAIQEENGQQFRKKTGSNSGRKRTAIQGKTGRNAGRKQAEMQGENRQQCRRKTGSNAWGNGQYLIETNSD